MNVAASVETVNDFVSELGWGTSGESGVAVDPVARDASTGDIRGVSEVEDSASDEMGTGSTQTPLTPGPVAMA